MITIKQFLVSGFDDNCAYVLYDDESLEAIVVDPSGAIKPAMEYINEHSLSVVRYVLTHSHHDHFDALALALAEIPVPLMMHTSAAKYVAHDTAELVNDGSTIALGDYQVTVLHTPGHTADSICLFVPAASSASGTPLLITGDTLFVTGCGRTSESGVKDLYDSLVRLKTLPSETVIYPGHDYGPTSTATLGDELASNQYLTAPDFTTFKARRLPK